MKPVHTVLSYSTLDQSNRRKYRLIYKFIHFDLQDVLESIQLYLKYEIKFHCKYTYLVISKYRRRKDVIENFAYEFGTMEKVYIIEIFSTLSPFSLKLNDSIRQGQFEMFINAETNPVNSSKCYYGT
jgi:hypothetical protein